MLYEKITKIYPQLTVLDFDPVKGSIVLQNDGDNDYIAVWNHSLPKPTDEQLA